MISISNCEFLSLATPSFHILSAHASMELYFGSTLVWIQSSSNNVIKTFTSIFQNLSYEILIHDSRANLLNWKVEIESFRVINLHCQKKEEGNAGVLRGSRRGQEDQIPLQNSNFLNLNYKYQRYLYLKEIQICKKWYLFILFQYFDLYTSTLR